ncbi:MAG: glycosyltransferase [Bacteroidota bacterium]
MLSICIPIYNLDVSALISELDEQSKQLNTAVEIALIDDASDAVFKKKNEEVCKKLKYIELEKNIGRARIRNLFLQYTSFDNLLFIDCDSTIISKDYISMYLEVIKQYDYPVICGSSIYDNYRPERNKMLRWKYGFEKESKPFEVRSLLPNKSFMTNNFLIKRKVFEKIRFDERITKYGHEDTLFGYELKRRGINIHHMDNPVLNGNIETNSEYLKKTETGIINLIQILNYVDDIDEFIQDLTLLNYYKKMHSLYLTQIILFIYLCTKPFIRFSLINGFVNLKLFDFYKLGFLIQHINSTNKIN